MEFYFDDKFYNPQPNISIVDLMNTKQFDESDTKFLEQFKWMRSKCNVNFPKSKYKTITIGNMATQLRERLLTKDYVDLT